MPTAMPEIRAKPVAQQESSATTSRIANFFVYHHEFAGR
jgi:hypothetical protein